MQEVMKDKLTGCLNETYFLKRLDEEIRRVKRYKHNLSILLIAVDYDFFEKTFNVKWGMSYTILKQLGAQVIKVFRDVDLPGRYKGDFFVVSLPETGSDGAKIAAERLRSYIEEHSFLGNNIGERIRIAVSVSIVVFPEDGEEADILLQAALDCLEKGRQEKGGNAVFCTTPEG